MKGIAAVFYRDYRQRVTNIGFVFWDMFVPLAYLALFGVGFERGLGTSLVVSDRAVDYTTFLLPGVVAMLINAARVIRRGRVAGSGCQRQKYVDSEPNSSRSSRARFALLIVDSILPRCRTMPGSPSRRRTSRAVNRATRSGSKLAKPRRKLSRFLRIVSQLSPA